MQLLLKASQRDLVDGRQTPRISTYEEGIIDTNPLHNVHKKRWIYGHSWKIFRIVSFRKMLILFSFTYDENSRFCSIINDFFLAVSKEKEIRSAAKFGKNRWVDVILYSCNLKNYDIPPLCFRKLSFVKCLTWFQNKWEWVVICCKFYFYIIETTDAKENSFNGFAIMRYPKISIQFFLCRNFDLIPFLCESRRRM